MKLVIAFLLCIATYQIKAQVFLDDFSDGNFTDNPEWTGQVTDFQVNSDNQLQLDATEAGLSHLATSVNQILTDDVEWRFHIRQSFSGSGNNNSRMYLMSNQADVTYTGVEVPNLEGYFLQFGESGSDDAIELFRNDEDGTQISIARGLEGSLSSSFEITLKIKRSATGNWEIWSEENAEDGFVFQASGIDDTYSEMSHLAWVCKYTTSNSTKFYLDEVYFGELIIDTQAPEIISLSVLSSSELMLEFNEPLEEVSTELLSNYLVSEGIGTPSSVALLTSNNVLLSFDSNFPSGVELILTVFGIEDLNSNMVAEVGLPFTFFQISEPEPGDLIFTEIFADPTPQVGLPNIEWIEIYNVSENTVDLGQIEFYNSDVLNEIDSYILTAGEYVIISSESGTSELMTFGNSVSSVPFSALTNSSDSLTLIYNGSVIDQVVYNSSWYMDSDKSEGGWSLERINLNHPCSDHGNWRVSESTLGGTPGEQNSVSSEQSDEVHPVLTLIYAESSQAIIIEFDEPISEGSLVGVNASLNGQEAELIEAIGMRTIRLEFGLSMEPSVIYELTIGGVEDCWGNSISVQTAIVGLTEEAESGDLIINEVLSNPRGVGSDHVEIYNRSDKIINLKNWKLAKSDQGELLSENTITEYPFSLFPGEYLLFTESIENTLQNYPFTEIDRCLIMDLPAYSNDDGGVVLIKPDDLISDEFYYDESHHFGLIDDTDGVALERLSFSVATQNEGNWSSAAQDQNFATPGYKNSQALDITETTGTLTTKPEVFSPDNDGYHDNLAIYYDSKENNNVINLSIFNKDGVQVRKLVSNELIGPSGVYFWDGLNDLGERLSVGVYVIYAEIFRLDGTVRSYKTPAVIAHF